MPRKSVLLTTFALVLLAAAWPSTPTHAHCDGKHTGNHPHCAPGGPGGDDALYEVTMMTGDFWSEQPAIFEGTDGGGSSQTILVYFQALDLDLTFLFNKFGALNLEDRGTKCFAGTPLQDYYRSMQVFQDQDGLAQIMYWFRGYGDDGATEVKYLLRMSGHFLGPGNWRPDLAEINVVELDTWGMTIEGKKNRKIACTDAAGAVNQQIAVERIN